MFSINQLFEIGMKRTIPALIEPGSVKMNLGCGNTHMPDSLNLEWPSWKAERDPIPSADGNVDTIFASHFFEHLAGDTVISVLKECQRALRVGGQLNITVPYYRAQLAFQDLDHKSFWTEETLRTLFVNKMYDKGREEPWRLSVNFCVIIGIVERNLALLIQLVRTE